MTKFLKIDLQGADNKVWHLFTDFEKYTVEKGCVKFDGKSIEEIKDEHGLSDYKTINWFVYENSIVLNQSKS